MKKVMIYLLLAGFTGGCSTTAPLNCTSPTSDYCIERGGKLHIEKHEEGERGICYLADGEKIDEWELFRSETNAQK